MHFYSAVKPLRTHASKLVPEIGAINSMPDSGAYVIPSGIKFVLAPISGVE